MHEIPLKLKADNLFFDSETDQFLDHTKEKLIDKYFFCYAYLPKTNSYCLHVYTGRNYFIKHRVYHIGKNNIIRMKNFRRVFPGDIKTATPKIKLSNREMKQLQLYAEEVMLKYC